jgi:transcriptional regulator with XRE-family HTH domain
MVQNKRRGIDLHQLVNDAIEQLSEKQPAGGQLLGTFLQMKLDKLGWSEQQFAEKLGMPAEGVHALLTGKIPDWFISDAAITRIADLLQEDLIVLNALIGRVTPAIPLSADEIAEMLDGQ